MLSGLPEMCFGAILQLLSLTASRTAGEFDYYLRTTCNFVEFLFRQFTNHGLLPGLFNLRIFAHDVSPFP